MFDFLRKEFPTGMVPDPARDNDPRNLQYDDIAPLSGADVPDTGDIEKGSWTLNQNRSSSCTCHSTVYAVNQVIGMQLSPRYVYHEIKTNPKYPSSTLPHGAYMVDSVKVMCDAGIAEYLICPNDGTESDEAYLNYTPTISVTDSAAHHKGGSYVYVTNSTDNAFKCAQIVRFMYEQQKPVKVGITWHSSFNNARKTGIVPATPPTGNLAGHDMLAVAWKSINGVRYIGFRNSWGPDWGDHGRIWIPRELLKISAGIAYVAPLPKPVAPDSTRDEHLEKYTASELRKVIYAKFPLDIASEVNTTARSLAGRLWLVLVQGVSYRGWTNTDVINYLYAHSRNMTDTKAYSFDFNIPKK